MSTWNQKLQAAIDALTEIHPEYPLPEVKSEALAVMHALENLALKEALTAITKLGRP